MRLDNIKDKVDVVVYPISIVCLLSEFITLIFEKFELLLFNTHISFLIVFVQFISTTVLFFLYRKLKSNLFLYESFADDRVSLFLAIKFVLNLKGKLNYIRVNKVSLMVSITNIPDIMGNILDERYDCEFIWRLEGENTAKKEVDKLYFRLAGDNSIDLNFLKFKAYQCQDIECKYCQRIEEREDLRKECVKYDMKYNINDAVQKKNFYILPLEFKRALLKNEKFRVNVAYTWPKCYNALVDYLIIDPYNFSTEVNTFEVSMKIDDKIITESTNARVCYIVRDSTMKREIHGIETLMVYKKDKEKYLKSNEIKCDKKNIYFVEITK